MFIELYDTHSDGLHENEHNSGKWTASGYFFGGLLASLPFNFFSQ